MNNVRIDPLASRELADGADYYDEKAPGLGDAFLLEAGQVFRQLSEAPLSAPLLNDQLRRRPLFRFPYSVLYRVVETEIQIIAIVHQMRGPKYLAKRLRKENRDG